MSKYSRERNRQESKNHRRDGLTNHDRITLREAQRNLHHTQQHGEQHPRKGMSLSRYRRMLRRGHALHGDEVADVQ